MSFRALLRSRVAWVSAGSLAVVGESALFGALGRARDGWPPVQDGPWGAP